MKIFYKITMTIVVLGLLIDFVGAVIHNIEILQLGICISVVSSTALVLGAIWD